MGRGRRPLHGLHHQPPREVLFPMTGLRPEKKLRQVGTTGLRPEIFSRKMRQNLAKKKLWIFDVEPKKKKIFFFFLRGSPHPSAHPSARSPVRPSVRRGLVAA